MGPASVCCTLGKWRVAYYFYDCRAPAARADKGSWIMTASRSIMGSLTISYSNLQLGSELHNNRFLLENFAILLSFQAWKVGCHAILGLSSLLQQTSKPSSHFRVVWKGNHNVAFIKVPTAAPPLPPLHDKQVRVNRLVAIQKSTVLVIDDH